jgi:ABC-type amino acid transport substrate-binding protein
MRRITFIRTLAACCTIGLVAIPGVSHAQSTLQAVKSRGTMIAGVRFDSPPYGFVDASGKNVGFDIDFAEEIARRMGVKLELVRVTGQSRIPTLNSGKIDLLVAALTKTAEREKVVDFTMTYITDGAAVVVKKGSPIKTPADLNGRSVAFVQGTTVDAGLKEAAPNAQPIKYQEYPAAFLAFQQGLADAFIGQAFGLDQFLKAEPGKYEVLTKWLYADPIAIGVRKGDTEWKNALDTQLKAIVADGTWNKIVKKHVSIAVEAPKVSP